MSSSTFARLLGSQRRSRVAVFAQAGRALARALGSRVAHRRAALRGVGNRSLRRQRASQPVAGLGSVSPIFQGSCDFGRGRPRRHTGIAQASPSSCLAPLLTSPPYDCTRSPELEVRALRGSGGSWNTPRVLAGVSALGRLGGPPGRSGGEGLDARRGWSR